MRKIFVLFCVCILLLFSLCSCELKKHNSSGGSAITSTNSVKNVGNNFASTDNSVEKIYNDFLSGKITAVYGDGSDINIDYLTEMASPHTLTYAFFDRNGDSVPELCINNELYITTFWVQNGTLKLWREENFHSKILSNGNCLETHYGGAPNHTDYSYIVYSYTGDKVCSLTVSVLIKNDIDILENIYTQDIHVYNGSTQSIPSHIEITKEYFDSVLESIEKIGEAKIEWQIFTI